MPDMQAPRATLVAIDAVPAAAWTELAGRALEPNAFYDPDWARAVAAHARGHSGAKALLAWDGPAQRRLIGLLPVVSAWQALKLPLPILVAWQAYAPLTTPLLDRDAAGEAARGLLDAAGEAQARALMLRHLPAAGAAATALRRVLAERGIAPQIVRRYQRARLDATGNPESALHDALGGGKLKELRRQRKRLSDHGAVSFELASQPDAVAGALEKFLALEAGGWKGRRGTALARHAGDLAFIRQAAAHLAAGGRFQVATLSCAGAPVAGGLVLRQGRRAFFYKIAYDEIWAKASPGVQLTLELSRHLCADPGIDDVDSMADTGHPMIDHVWSGRGEIADVLLATRAGDPAIAPMRQLLAAQAAAYGFARRLRDLISLR